MKRIFTLTLLLICSVIMSHAQMTKEEAMEKVVGEYKVYRVINKMKWKSEAIRDQDKREATLKVLALSDEALKFVIIPSKKGGKIDTIEVKITDYINEKLHFSYPNYNIDLSDESRTGLLVYSDFDCSDCHSDYTQENYFDMSSDKVILISFYRTKGEYMRKGIDRSYPIDNINYIYTKD